MQRQALGFVKQLTQAHTQAWELGLREEACDLARQGLRSQQKKNKKKGEKKQAEILELQGRPNQP